MKTTYKFLFLCIGLAMMGCSNLEEEPVGRLSPDGFFSTVKDIQTATNAAYGHMQHEDFWGRKMSLTIMLRSDMVDIGDPTTAARRIQHNNFSVPADNGMIPDFWKRTYQMIAATNQAIAGAEEVNAADNVKNPIVAQARFVRAFAYFHLVRQFGEIPYLDEPVTDRAVTGSIGKSSVADIYENIITDLKFAKKWLPNTQEARSIPSKAAAHSYLALVYLTKGDFQKAYEEAKGVIDNEGVYNLALEADFQNLFNAGTIDSSKEPIFTIDFNGFRSGDSGQDYQPALTGIRSDEQYGIGGGWSVAVPSLAVYNSWDDQDYRKQVSFDATGVFKGNVEPYTNYKDFNSRAVNRPHIAKYTRFTGTTANNNGRGSQHNYSMMRYAEVLLIAAEALNEIQAGSVDALSYINRVRERARNGSTFPADLSGLSQVEFRTAVLEERRLELAFEFKRWYDIARRKMGDQVFSASGFEGAKPDFDSNQDYLMPLPPDELTRNANLLPQNTGY